MTTSTLKRPMPFRSLLIATTFLIAASPLRAADFQIDGLKLELGSMVITVPKLDVKGSPLEREAFTALLNGSSGESAVARLSKLTATEISAPELRMEQTAGPRKQSTAYRDIRLSNVREGRIAQGEAARGTVSVTGTTSAPMSGELGRARFETIDLKQLARVMTESAKPGVPEAMQPIIGRYDQEGYVLDMGPAGKFTIGRMSGRDIAAKVGDEPLNDLIARIVTLSEATEKASREPGAAQPSLKTPEEKRLILSLLSLYDMMSYGSGEVVDMAATVTPPATEDKPKTRQGPIDFKIARIGYGGETAAKPGFAVEGLQFRGNGAAGSFDSISYSGFSLQPIITELKALLSQPDADFENLDFRKLIPTIGTMRFAGISIDAPQDAKPGQPALPPLKLGLGLFELKAGEQLNGVPTSMSVAMDNLRVPVVDSADKPAMRDLIAMGYKMLDVSARIDLAWEALRNELSIRSISLSGEGMGSLAAKGTLGNVTKDLFSSDLALAQVAALGATVRNIEAKLHNTGLFEKLIQNEARKGKRKPDEIRQQYAMMASLGLAAILGPSDAAKALTAAVSRFVAKPGTLAVEASARSASGLGLADVVTMADPTEIFDKIDLKANAE